MAKDSEKNMKNERKEGRKKLIENMGKMKKRRETIEGPGSSGLNKHAKGKKMREEAAGRNSGQWRQTCAQ